MRFYKKPTLLFETWNKWTWPLSVGGLRWQLTLMVLAVVAGPLILVGLVTGHRSFTSLAWQGLTLQRQVAANVGSKIRTFVDQRTNELKLLDSLHGIGISDRKRQHRLLSALLLYQHVYEELALLDGQGQEQLRLSRSRVILDKELRNRASESVFRLPMAKSETYFSPVRFDPMLREPLLTLALPLIDLRHGHSVGVLVADLRFRVIWNLLAGLPTPSYSDVYVVDQSGQVVAHGNPSLVLQGTVADVSRREGQVAGLSGHRVILAKHELRFGRRKLIVMAEQPVDKALALAIENQRLLIAVTLGALALTAIFVVLSTRRSVRPLEELATAAEAMSRGEFPLEVAADTQNEIGQLALAFNRMVQHLRVARTGLERRVQERTVALQESEARFRLMVDAAPMLVWMTGIEGQCTFVNQPWLAFTGRELEEELDWGWMERLHPDDVAPYQAAYHTALASHSVFQVEYRLRRADDLYRWFVMVGVSRLTSDGVYAGYIGSCLDVTERKQAEEALWQQQELLRVTLTSIGDGVITTDTQSRVTFLNRVAETLTGWSEPEALGHPLETVFRIVHEETRAPAANPVTRALAEGRVVGLANHTALLPRHGGEVPIADSSAPILDGAGLIQGAVLIFRDVSNSRRLEEDLHRSRTMQAMGTLAGGIAHEFNNQLSAVLGFAQLIEREVDERGTVGQYTRQILMAGDRSKELVQQILAFSRQSPSGQREPVLMYQLVDAALKFFQVSLPSNITLQGPTKTSGSVFANSSQIHQVVLNLCANATYAMRERGGQLSIRIEKVEVTSATADNHPKLIPNLYVQLVVQDTGGGIDPDIQSRIFEPFFTTKEIGEGTGMGLAIVHGIVADHGGGVTVTSEVDEGTTVIVYLPEVEPEGRKELGRPSLTSHTSVRILFVDDEQALVQSTQAILSQLGHIVVAEVSPLAALARFQENPESFDLLITDQTMPGMTGMALMNACRKIRPSFPTIICTGFSYAINTDNAERQGADAFLTKPLDFHELNRSIDQILAQRRLQS